MHLLTPCLVQHRQHFARKIGRVEIIRPLDSVVCSISHLHFILPGAIPVPVGGCRTQVAWLKSPVQGWHWKLEAKLRKVAAYPLSPHIYPLSVGLFWGCWKPGLSSPTLQSGYDTFTASHLLKLFFLPDLLVGWSFSGFNCLTFWHIICRCDLYNHTGRQFQLYEHSEYSALFSLH